jgi:hypothetical protein
MHRVLRPGGRAGIIVRAEDQPRYWNIEGTAELLEALHNNRGPVSPGGCGDRSLYERVQSRFGRIDPYPDWFTTHPPIANMVQFTKAALPPECRAPFEDALRAGNEAGTAFLSIPMHCVVATKA